jgi:hypothetical protein
MGDNDQAEEGVNLDVGAELMGYYFLSARK